MPAAPRRILVSRTDAIGDVLLTLPLCGLLKRAFPDTEIWFLGRTYTLPVVACCPEVDGLGNWDAIAARSPRQQAQALHELGADVILHVFPRGEIAWAAWRAGIASRVGTQSRPVHWPTCNHLVALHRKNSPLHEAQLNLKLAEHLLPRPLPALDALAGTFRFQPQSELPQAVAAWRKSLGEKPLVVLHPKSRGSAREWPLAGYLALMQQLGPQPYHFAITGTQAEAETMRSFLQQLPANATNLAGKLSLSELIALIASAQGIVAASTGPLHIGAALGIAAIGIYPPMRPIHPGRWAPVGRKATALASPKPDCTRCRKAPQACHCMAEISPQWVAEALVGRMNST